jgi:NAD dependent epimerase/dehydratase
VKNDLDGRRILVTGAGGFIGSHLTEALLARGARVRALVHYDSRGSWGELSPLRAEPPAALEVRPGDVRDPFLVDSLVQGVDVVVHLAALIPIPYSYVAPAEFVDTNVRGTLHLLEAARRHGVARFLHTSTSEVYGSALYTPIDERHPLQAQSPYAASKIGADALVESYGRSFGVSVAIVRPFNTYGPRQSTRAFLPAVLAQLLRGDVVRVGSLDPVRDMNYVDDTVAGFVAACTATNIEGSTLNLGSGRGISMRSLLELAEKAAGRRARVEVEPSRLRPEASEVRELVCDPSAARAKLGKFGWTPAVPLEEGVERTARWIADHLDRFEPPFHPF